MDVKEAEQLLNLFNEKADKLAQNSFLKKMVGSKVTLSWKGKGHPVIAERKGPDDEAIESFVLTIRYFIQDNEVGFQRLDKEVYQQFPIPQKLKQKFSKLRAAFNIFLDREPQTSFTINNHRPTNREIMEVFIYGGLAHANQEKKKIFDHWEKIILFEHLKNEFAYIITKVFQAVMDGKNINEKVLKRLEQQS